MTGEWAREPRSLMDEIFVAIHLDPGPHVFFGALAGAGLVVLMALGLVSGTWAFVVLALIFAGIAVDVMVHGYME